MEIIGIYLYRFGQRWLFWFWAPALDVLMFFTDPYIPGFSIPREVYWAVPLIGIVIANMKLFTDVESEKRSLQKRIDELESTKANICLEFVEAGFHHSHLGVPSPFPEVEINQYGFDERGLPGWASIWADLTIKNTGYEPGELVWSLDRAKSHLPPLFVIDEDFDGEFYKGPLGRIEPQAWFGVKWKLYVRVTEQDPRSFAQALSSLEHYSIVVKYHTRRIDGESNQQFVTIEGDFRGFCEKVLEYWEWRHKDLAQIGKSQ